MVGTYEHHSLIIVNYGTESRQNIVNFIEQIRQKVHYKFNIWLEPEVRIF